MNHLSYARKDSEYFYIVSYDVTDNKRRNRVAKILPDFGKRVQYSVFEVVLDTQARFTRLVSRLGAAIEPERDSIRISYLCASCREKQLILGRGEYTEDRDVYVV